MAFTRVEKPHLFIAGLPALPYPCVKRSFFFHRNGPLTYPKGEVDPDPLRLSFSFPYDKNRLSMTIPAGKYLIEMLRKPQENSLTMS